MSIRTQAPETRVISNLDFAHVQPAETIGGNPVYHCPRRELGVLKFELYWPTGTAHQGHKFLARTANSLRLNGTKDLSAEQVLEGFEYLGASVGTDTGLLASSVSLKVRTEAFEEALTWLLKVMKEADYPETELQNYQQIESASLMRRMQTPRYWSSRVCLEALYGPESPDTSFSNPEDIAALSRQLLPDWCHTWLRPSDATLFLSGDAGEKELALVQKLFSEHTSGVKATIAGTQGTLPVVSGPIMRPVEHSNQVSMYWAKKLPVLSAKQLQETSLLNMFLGGFFGSRLMQELREERGLTYGIGSNISSASAGNTLVISGEMNSANAAAAMEATAEIMRSLISNPPSGDELDKAKRYYAGQLRSGFDGPFALPGKIQFLQQRGFDYSYYDQALNRIWSVTTDDLCALADNLLQPETFTIALAGDVKT